MKIIGLTGGIGSGKSTVARFLEELGAAIIDADKLGHQALKEPEIKQRVVATFGQQVLGPGGDIDRKKLGRLVFGDPKHPGRLNKIMHPRIYQMVKAWLDQYRRQGVAVVVIDVPLLVEAGWTKMVDEVWVTIASRATVLERLKQRLGLSQPESLARLASQPPPEERLKYADVVIDTDCSLEELRAKVKELWPGLSL